VPDLAEQSGVRGERVLVTGRMLAPGRERPVPWAALLEDGRVVASGPDPGSLPDHGGAERLRLGPDEVGFAGFADPHLHLLSTAAATLSLDCSVTTAPTLPRLLTGLARAAAALPAGTWLRGQGFDEALVAERRAPTLAELNHAVPDHPLVLHHASGHTALLNGPALRALGGPDHADGLLVRRHDVLAGVPRLDEAVLRRAVGVVCGRMWDAGVVAFTDATHTNGAADIDALGSMTGDAPQQVTAMAGWDRLAGLRFGERRAGITVGHAKVLLVGADARIMGEAVTTAHAAGFPVAVHAADIEELALALDAIHADPAPAGTRDRIEHCSLALPEQVNALGRLGVEVVTQPSFLRHRAAKYRRELTGLELGWLWRLRSLVDAGVPVRLSSDSPVVPCVPEDWLAAATDRPLGDPAENLDRDTALAVSAAGPLRSGAHFLSVDGVSVRHLGR
jgi:predicted amidohydrolase YtcJ